MDLLQWISVIEVPVFLAVMAWIAKSLSDERKDRSEGDSKLHKRVDDLAEAFAACRRECAMTFLSKADGRDQFARLDTRLERIEQKLDAAMMRER
jgi:hypothetical protein